MRQKDIEIEEAFSDSVLSVLGDDVEGSLMQNPFQCGVFISALSRLGAANVAKISKILATLP